MSSENVNAYYNKTEEYCNIMNIKTDYFFDNPKEEFRYFCYKYLDYIRLIDLPTIKQNNYYEAVLIEFRCLPHLEFLIRNCIDKLGEKWSHTIVCGLNNYDYVHNIVKSMDRNIKIIKTNFKNLFQNEYSEYLMTKEFWNLFYGEKILLYQEDTCIFKYNIDDFLKWDYIGAPWMKTQNDTPNCVGNGGLSLRSKSCMLKVLDRITYQDTRFNSSTLEYMRNSKLMVPPEDVYFSKNMQEFGIGNVADWDSAHNFSMETLLNDNSFGGHGIWGKDIEYMKKIMYTDVVKTFDVLKDFHELTDHRGGWNIVKNELKLLVNQDTDMLFVDGCDGYFFWGENKWINRKWFGFIHCTPVTPEYFDWINLNSLFKNVNFMNSLNSCQFIMTLSPYITKFLKKKFEEYGYNIKVFSIHHPTDFEVPLFDFNQYKSKQNKKIIQIGQQLRRITSIYELKTDFEKVWLTGLRDQERITNMLKTEIDYFKLTHIDIDSVERKYIHSHSEYDNLFIDNVIFIHMFDAAANNAIIECIARNTPIVINKLEGAVDYLGEDYPLYFDTLEEVPNLLKVHNIEKAHLYLKNLKKDHLNSKHFVRTFVNIIHSKLRPHTQTQSQAPTVCSVQDPSHALRTMYHNQPKEHYIVPRPVQRPSRALRTMYYNQPQEHSQVPRLACKSVFAESTRVEHPQNTSALSIRKQLLKMSSDNSDLIRVGYN